MTEYPTFRTAVVTGGATGLGEAFCRQLAEQGTFVAILDIDMQAAEQLAAQLGTESAAAYACDVSATETLEQVLAQVWREHNGFDLLVNNAGVMGYGRLESAEPQNLNWQMQVNVMAPWIATRWFYKKLVATDGRGHVINISSEHGLGVPHLEAGFYTASKHALLGLSEVMAEEMADRIDLTIACPGIVATRLWDAARNRPESHGGKSPGPSFLKKVQDQGKPAAEVASIILRGAADKARFVLTHAHLDDLVLRRAGALRASVAQYADLSEGGRYEVATIVETLKRGNPR